MTTASRDLPPELPAPRATAEVRARTRRLSEESGMRIAVLDDDPTGTQTVRDVPLVTSWEPEELRWAMTSAAPTFGVLTNARALAPGDAAAIARLAGERLAATALELRVPLRVLSRGDSTLRGHFPAEPEALAGGLAAGGGDQTDAVLVCPAFPEAGRVTVGDVHRVRLDERWVPVGETEFARDDAFGFRASDLRAWVCERAGEAATVASVSIEDLRLGGPEHVADRLVELAGTVRYVVANAAHPADLDVLALGVALAERAGRRFVYRTGPSFVAARAGLPPAQPLAREELASAGAHRHGHGLVVVGSHTALTTAQLDAAREQHAIEPVPLDVPALLEGGDAARAALARDTAARLRSALERGDAALVTSRAVARPRRGTESLQTARTIADALVEIVRATVQAAPPAWLIAKGGITAHDVAVRALDVRRARVLGQLFPGQVSVWEIVADRIAPGLQYVVFPGNVGDAQTLARAIDRMRGAA